MRAREVTHVSRTHANNHCGIIYLCMFMHTCTHHRTIHIYIYIYVQIIAYDVKFMLKQQALIKTSEWMVVPSALGLQAVACIGHVPSYDHSSANATGTPTAAIDVEHAEADCELTSLVALHNGSKNNPGQSGPANAATHRNTIQHTATHCNTPQHTASHAATRACCWRERLCFGRGRDKGLVLYISLYLRVLGCGVCVYFNTHVHK